jgi:hypothetical protein
VEHDLRRRGSSIGRGKLIPDVAPAYAGYVAWRGTVGERSLSPATHKAYRDAIIYQVLADSHILVYPIPGLDGSLAEGDRLINMVWHVNVAAGDDLDRLMTGRDGTRRAVSLPPGAATDEAVTGMRRQAEAVFAPPVAEVVTSVAEPFVQAVYDIAVPRMAQGRVCPGRRRRVRRPPACRGGHCQGGRRRVGARRRTPGSRRGRARRTGRVGTPSAAGRPATSRPYPRDRR